MIPYQCMFLLIVEQSSLRNRMGLDRIFSFCDSVAIDETFVVTIANVIVG